MSDRLDAIFAALADPTRRAILTMLLEDDMAVTDVAAPLPMSLAAVSKHLGVLAAAGLISQERRGRVKWCRLEPEALGAAKVWMAAFGQLDPFELDGFERFLEAELAALAAAVAAAEAETAAETASETAAGAAAIDTGPASAADAARDR